MKWRSPLTIPPQRGRVFRLAVSVTLGALAAWTLTQLWAAVNTGILDWQMRYAHIHVERALEPQSFWFYIAVFFVGFLWLLYACCAEILYAILWYESQQFIQRIDEANGPFRYKFSVFATSPCCGLSLSR